MKKIFAIVVIGCAALFAVGTACGPVEDTEPTQRPTAEEVSPESTWKGPVPPDQRPPRPAEGVEGIQGCPASGGIVVDIYFGQVTKSADASRIGDEKLFVLRWVNNRRMHPRDGGCWQQHGFDPDPMDRFDNCNIEGIKTDGDNWPQCDRG